MPISKSKLKKEFAKDWKKHYKLKAIESRGFHRSTCKSCGTNFWAVDSSRSTCSDPACVGYEFIGNSPLKKPMDLLESWNAYVKYFKKNGHTIIDSYPSVCRWRDDLYFTIASITDF
ncbi:MAG: alanine--tRNA ligase, partial [Candidatus Diapherotrites archaeon]|nr:alanine--tRNA ligase [Candidatus Diapherotrites archaeon]